MVFSFIIPVYNVAPYLRACLGSVMDAAKCYRRRDVPLRQIGEGASSIVAARRLVNQEVEIICVDDGSTDGSAEILDSILDARGDMSTTGEVRFRVVHQANAGVSAARNVGLKMATGDWIAFLDGDDVLSPQMLSVCAHAIETHPNVDAVVYGTECFTDGESWTGWQEGKAVGGYHDTSNRFSLALNSGFASRIYRRGMLKGVMFPAYTVGEDLVFLVRAMLRARSVVDVSVPLYGYRQRADSAIHSLMTLRKLRDHLSFSADILTLLAQSEKLIGQGVAHPYINGWIEAFWQDYFRLPKCARKDAGRLWLDSLNESGKFWNVLPLFQRIRIRVVLRMRNIPCAIALCYVPHWLKLKGLHR